MRPNPRARTCPTCKKEFVRPNHDNTVHCSRKCINRLGITKGCKHKDKTYLRCRDCDCYVENSYRCTICHIVRRRIKDRIHRPKNTYVQKSKNIRKELILLSGGACVKCGYNNDNRALCFHHQEPSDKTFQITSYAATRYTESELYLEHQKCILVCQNCHAIIHQNLNLENISRTKYPKYNLTRRNKRMSLKLWLIGEAGGACEKCQLHFNESNYQAASFHHIVRYNKGFDFGLVLNKHNEIHKYTKEDLLLELAKCKLLCLNCHMEEESDSYIANLATLPIN